MSPLMGERKLETDGAVELRPGLKTELELTNAWCDYGDVARPGIDHIAGAGASCSVTIILPLRHARQRVVLLSAICCCSGSAEGPD